jgi:iron complex transport system substrate-binding protein
MRARLLFLLLGAAACTRGEGSSSASTPPALEILVAIGPGTEANLFALGLGGRVAGVSDFCTVAEADAIPRVGGQANPNLERIAALAPSLVLVQGRHPLVEEWCVVSGVEFRAFTTDSIAGWREEVAWLGIRFGIPAEAGALVRRVDLELAALRPGGSSLTHRALLVVARHADEASGILAAGPNTFLSELLALAGGENVLQNSSQAYVDVNEESLVRLDPQVIFEFWPDSVPPDPPLAIWRRAFPGLAAVRNGRVMTVTHRECLIPGPRMPEIARAIATALR